MCVCRTRIYSVSKHCNYAFKLFKGLLRCEHTRGNVRCHVPYTSSFVRARYNKLLYCTQPTDSNDCHLRDKIIWWSVNGDDDLQRFWKIVVVGNDKTGQSTARIYYFEGSNSSFWPPPISKLTTFTGYEYLLQLLKSKLKPHRIALTPKYLWR